MVYNLNNRHGESSFSKQSEHLLFLSQNMAQKWVEMTTFKPNGCLQEWQLVEVFTIKQLRWVIAACQHALYVSWAFGAELKQQFLFFVPPIFFPADNFYLSMESVSLPQKFVLLQTIPMPGNYSGVKIVALVTAISKHNTEYTTNKQSLSRSTFCKIRSTYSSLFFKKTGNLKLLLYKKDRTFCCT